MPTVRERNRAETHRRLLRVGTQVFAERGVRNTRTTDLARAGGVAIGTLYFHFGDKDGMLREILDDGVARLEAAMAGSGRPAADMEAMIRDHVESMVAFSEAHCAMTRLLFDSEIRRGPDHRVVEDLVRAHEAQVRHCQERGWVRSDLHPNVIARASVGMVVHTLGWWCARPQRVPREELVETLVQLRLSGLRPTH